MICPRCNQTTTRLIIDKHGEGCANCRGISEAGGAKISGILTRNSERVRAQQHTHEGDMILPHTFDPITNQVIPNPDFVDMYPDKLPTYFTKEELEKAGYSKADKIFDHKAAQEAEVAKEMEDVEFAEDAGGEKMAEVIESL